MISWWRSRAESVSFGFSGHCVRMQWVANTNSSTNTNTSILYPIQWQDRTRISASLSISKNYCTLSESGACSIARKFAADSHMPHKITHFLVLKPPMKHINRSNSTTGKKYQKLCSYFNRFFPSKKVMSALWTGFATKDDCWFLRGWWHFATLVHPKSIILPHPRSILSPETSFTSTNVGNLSWARRHRYISVQL